MCNFDDASMSFLVSPAVAHDAVIEQYDLPKLPNMLNPSMPFKQITPEGRLGERYKTKAEEAQRSEEKKLNSMWTNIYSSPEKSPTALGVGSKVLGGAKPLTQSTVKQTTTPMLGKGLAPY